MARDVETVWVVSCRPDMKVNFYERHDDHPDGVAMVAGDIPQEVARTPNVAKALRDPDGIREVSDADRQRWMSERENRRVGAVEQAMSAGMAPAAEVSQLRNEIAELRAMMGREKSEPKALPKPKE
jgi:hypothetical protein